MRFTPIKTPALAIAAAAIFGTVTMAFSAIDPQHDAASAPLDSMRPMDDIGGNIPYGDLSVFDAITEIGEAQSVDVPYCDHRATLLSTLDHDFAERPRLQHSLARDRSVELWASDVMGTWTAVYTRSDGVSCVISSGIGWTAQTDPVALLTEEKVLPAA